MRSSFQLFLPQWGPKCAPGSAIGKTQVNIIKHAHELVCIATMQQDNTRIAQVLCPFIQPKAFGLN